MKKLSILGSTGSIGKQALSVVRSLTQSGDFPVKPVALTAHSNTKLMEDQAREFNPELVVMYEETAAKDLRERLSDTKIKVLAGLEGLCEAAAISSADITLNSVMGMVGLRPTLEAIRAKKTIALANKETLVAAGTLVKKELKANGVKMLPVDSEHSAIFQCLEGCHDKGSLKKLIITASGGPFFGKTQAELENVKAEDALKHPNWDMGKKITIDSATMMNKGLEVIEAHFLFDVEVEHIDVVVHRESIIHSMIEYADNSVIAQLGLPDMAIPIQYALTYPERFPSPAGELDFSELAKMTFFKPDNTSFRCLPICIEALKKGGLAPAAVNGANEEAVAQFLEGKIGFLDIANIAEAALNAAPSVEEYTLEDVLEADKSARELARQLIK